MTQRRTYHERNQTPGDDGMGGVGVDPPPPPPPAPPPSTWLKTTLSIALGAVIGAVAVDVYRRIKGGMTKNPDDDDMQGGYSAMGGLPGGPSIMPFPMPLPMPMPMPMPMYGGMGMAPGYRDERPMTDVDKLELARLKAETAKAEAAKAHWDAWENGDVD
jgi:hypothetical protein